MTDAVLSTSRSAGRGSNAKVPETQGPLCLLRGPILTREIELALLWKSSGSVSPDSLVSRYRRLVRPTAGAGLRPKTPAHDWEFQVLPVVLGVFERS